jgi:hypothetical protein
MLECISSFPEKYRPRADIMEVRDTSENSLATPINLIQAHNQVVGSIRVIIQLLILQ